MNKLTRKAPQKKVKLGGDVAEFTNKENFNSKEYTDSGISVVQVTNISNNTLNLDQCKCYHLKVSQSIKNTYYLKGI